VAVDATEIAPLRHADADVRDVTAKGVGEHRPRAYRRLPYTSAAGRPGLATALRMIAPRRALFGFDSEKGEERVGETRGGLRARPAREHRLGAARWARPRMEGEGGLHTAHSERSFSSRS